MCTYVRCIYMSWCTEEAKLDAELEAELEAELRQDEKLERLQRKKKNKGTRQYTVMEQLQYQYDEISKELNQLEQYAEKGGLDKESHTYKRLQK